MMDSILTENALSRGGGRIVSHFNASHFARVLAARAAVGERRFLNHGFARIASPVAVIAAPTNTLRFRSGPKLLRRA